MLEGKLYVEVEQEYYGYGEGYGESRIVRIFLGPKGSTIDKLRKEWCDATWATKNVLRKGVLVETKKKYQTIPFSNWLVEVRGCTLLQESDYDVIDCLV